METIFLHYLQSWSWLVYILIFIGMFVEGDIIIFFSFYLVRQGELNPFMVIAVTFVGVILGNMSWFKFGVYPEKWFPFLKKRIEKISVYLDDQLNKNLFRALLVSNFTYNFHHITLMRAGALKINFKKYLENDLVSTLIWIAVIGGLGYGSSLSFLLFKKYLRFAEVGLLIGLIILLILMKLFYRYAKKYGYRKNN